MPARLTRTACIHRDSIVQYPAVPSASNERISNKAQGPEVSMGTCPVPIHSTPGGRTGPWDPSARSRKFFREDDRTISPFEKNGSLARTMRSAAKGNVEHGTRGGGGWRNHLRLGEVSDSLRWRICARRSAQVDTGEPYFISSRASAGVSRYSCTRESSP
ncbi:hypothetical protein C8R44DRAFT_50397 [Mycena epipterygia]|nr:hypothetical protein C8R44DRAFT_50397 [Mycena epipterygia]